MEDKDCAQLVEMLMNAVHVGDTETSRCCVAALANMNLKLDISIAQEKTNQEPEKPFKITVQVEDRESAGASFTLLVRSTDKIEDLKKRVQLCYKFPVEVQKWIVGKRIPDDKSTLGKCGVRSPTVIFLYLLTAHSIGLRPRQDGSGRDGVDKLEPAVAMDDSLLAFHTFQPADFDTNRLLYDERNVSYLDNTELLGFDPGNFSLEKEDEAEENDDGQTEESEVPSWKCPLCTYENRTPRGPCTMCSNTIPFTRVNEEYNGLKIGDRVVTLKDNKKEKGTVRWLGVLPDVEGNQISAGIEFDRPVGVGNGIYKGTRLFASEQDHAFMASPTTLMRVDDSDRI